MLTTTQSITTLLQTTKSREKTITESDSNKRKTTTTTEINNSMKKESKENPQKDPSIKVAAAGAAKKDATKNENEEASKKKDIPKPQQYYETVPSKKYPALYTPIEKAEQQPFSRCFFEFSHINRGTWATAIEQTMVFFIGIICHISYIVLTLSSKSNEIPFVSYFALGYYGLQIIPLILLWIGYRKKPMLCETRKNLLIPYIFWSIFYIVGCFGMAVMEILDLVYHYQFGAENGSVTYYFFIGTFMWFFMLYYIFMAILQIYFTSIIFDCFQYFSTILVYSKPAADQYRYFCGKISNKIASFIIGIFELFLCSGLIVGHLYINDFNFTLITISLTVIFCVNIVILIGLFFKEFFVVGSCLFFGFCEILALIACLIYFIFDIWEPSNELNERNYLFSTISTLIYSIIISFRAWFYYVAYQSYIYFEKNEEFTLIFGDEDVV